MRLIKDSVWYVSDPHIPHLQTFLSPHNQKMQIGVGHKRTLHLSSRNTCLLSEWVRLHQQMAQMLRSSESIHIWWYFVTFFTFSLKLAKHYHQAVLPNVYFLLMQHVCLSLLSNYQNLFRYQKKIICLVWHFSRGRWQLLYTKNSHRNASQLAQNK